ncbi:unnamed protein product [Meloidogyne enterolobii]|uniref:Uncharacterized protein n=1 Tax=Meloidogyne enterolobii TaxID=390850 RepID=A0ACB1B868_MELEN
MFANVACSQVSIFANVALISRIKANLKNPIPPRYSLKNPTPFLNTISSASKDFYSRRPTPIRKLLKFFIKNIGTLINPLFYLFSFLSFFLSNYLN